MYQLPLTLEELIRNRDWDGLSALAISKIPIIIGALIIVVVGFLISNIVANLVIKALAAKGVDSSIHSFIKTMISFCLKIIVLLSALSTLGVNVNSFVAALAAGGVAAGLGLQSSVSQFASGMLILINHPFKSGDFVEIGDVKGTVKEIKIMYTSITTLDNKKVIIPNSTVTSSNIVNYNAEKQIRIDLVYGISYDEDIDRAREAILKVANRFDLISKEPQTLVAVKEHSASSISLSCFVWCDPKNYWPVFFYMQEEVKKEFDKEKITIPFGQLDVHVK